MQGSFVNRVLLGTAAVVLALAWIVVPLSHAQPGELLEDCDLAVAPADPLAQAQPGELPDDCDRVPTPAIPFSQIQFHEVPGFGMQQPRPTPQFSQSVRSDELRSCRLEPSGDSAPARTAKQFVTRKPCREMDDREMDGMCGGITGSFDMTQSGNMLLTDNSAQSISLSDQAQQNLSSLVNILSINSTISVMLNLNVNINSTVGTVNQGNTGTQTGHP